jgi:hypothetical protein
MMQLVPCNVLLANAEMEITLSTTVWPAVDGDDDIALIRRDKCIAFMKLAVNLYAGVLNRSVSCIGWTDPVDIKAGSSGLREAKMIWFPSGDKLGSISL